ncbi:hypothetical protein CYMTET_12628 [Cymbomonas tetramitiformis]|uniref:Uncharacterized protein n=1 Tax=Cymbomonas tetramitiformis TaxID=36881 RepID=A0AAE0GK64_9CHLO|nr:hypothetical protein CYMTET_12628 [Cymbomonas tetramitiformis]
MATPSTGPQTSADVSPSESTKGVAVRPAQSLLTPVGGWKEAGGPITLTCRGCGCTGGHPTWGVVSVTIGKPWGLKVTAEGWYKPLVECGAHSVAIFWGAAMVGSGIPVKINGEMASDMGTVGGVEVWLGFMLVVG